MCKRYAVGGLIQCALRHSQQHALLGLSKPVSYTHLPNEFSKMVFDGLKEENKTPVTLIRGCWAGSQKYGTLVWSRCV